MALKNFLICLKLQRGNSFINFAVGLKIQLVLPIAPMSLSAA